MKKYRIVTNGIDFRVQWLGKTLFLRRPKWYWLYENSYAGCYIPSFISKHKAQTRINDAAEFDLAQKYGYTPTTAEVENDSN